MAKPKGKPRRRATSSKGRSTYDRTKIWLAAGSLVLGGIGAGLVIGTLWHRGGEAPGHKPDRPATHASVALPPPASIPAPLPNPAPIEPPPPAAAVPPPAAPQGPPVWQRHAVAPPGGTGTGHMEVAIVIDDMGLDRARSNRAAELPAPLTLSWLPYAEDLPAQTAAARRRGHELMVHVPMEPLSATQNAGPGVLTTRLGEEEILRNLRGALARFDGYVGINNHMGSRFTSYAPGMATVMSELKGRGLLWLDSRTGPNTVGMVEAKSYQVPSVERDVFLDDNPFTAMVDKQLLLLEGVVRKRGWGVAIGHPKDATIQSLARWLPTLKDKGIVAVPISEIVRRHGQSVPPADRTASVQPASGATPPLAP